MQKNNLTLSEEVRKNYEEFLEYKQALIDYYSRNIGLKFYAPISYIGKLSTKADVAEIIEVNRETGNIVIKLHQEEVDISYATVTDFIEEYGFYHK